MPGSFQYTLAVEVFAVVENGAELKQRVGPTRRGRIRDARGEHSVAHPFGDGGAFGPSAPISTSTSTAGRRQSLSCSMRVAASSHCTVSPRSGARRAVTYSSTTAHRSGRLPRM